jgi:hypothetical protein
VGAPISLWPALLRSGSSALSSSGERSQRNGNQPTTIAVVKNTEGKNSGSDPPGVGSPQPPRSLFDQIGPAGATLPPCGAISAMLSPRHGASPDLAVRGCARRVGLARYLAHLGCESAALVALVTA